MRILRAVCINIAAVIDIICDIIVVTVITVIVILSDVTILP
jgi:hypothetical protein